MGAYESLADYQISAKQFLDDPNLTQMRKYGYGPDYINNAVRTSLARARPQLIAAANEKIAELNNSGMAFSGLKNTAQAGVVSGLAATAQNAESQAWTQNEGARMEAENQFMNLQMTVDSMELQKRMALAQLENQKKTGWDYLLQGASVAAAFL